MDIEAKVAIHDGFSLSIKKVTQFYAQLNFPLQELSAVLAGFWVVVYAGCVTFFALSSLKSSFLHHRALTTRFGKKYSLWMEQAEILRLVIVIHPVRGMASWSVRNPKLPTRIKAVAEARITFTIHRCFHVSI